MGNLLCFSSPKKVSIPKKYSIHQCDNIPDHILCDVIIKAKYIEEKKGIHSPNLIVNIIKNTNWDIEYSLPEPSAPPM